MGESFLGGGGFGGGFGGGGYGGHHQHHNGIGLGYGTHHGGVGLGGYAEPHHYDGIIRNGRKVQYEMPRKEPTPQNLPSLDKFYDFEKNVLMHDRNQQMYEKNDPSYFEEPSSETASARGFVWTGV